MLIRLAIKNIGKSFRDYAVYFFTLVLGVCIFYMFNSIYAQKEIMGVTQMINESMESLNKILSYISVFVAVVLGFLIVYANNFFIKRRKKEFGIYMLLGMAKGKISKILVLETSLMAVVALVVGLLLGVLGSQFMSVFTANIFEADMTRFKFIFAPAAALKSILYFGVIFSVVIAFNTYSIGKHKLIDLLYDGRKNEVLTVEKLWVCVLSFAVSIVCLAGAYIIILKNGIIEVNLYFATSIVLGIVGTLLFFFSIAGILTKLIQSNEKLYFKNLNMFVLRQINSKINTNFISISVVCIVLLLVMGIFSSGYSLQSVISKDLKDDISYDFSIYNYSYAGHEAKPIYDNLPKRITSFNGIKSYGEFAVYEIPQSEMTFEDLGLEFGSDFTGAERDTVKLVTLSDYNKMRMLSGLEKFDLPKGRYAVTCTFEKLNGITRQLVTNGTILSVNDLDLAPVGKVEQTNVGNGVYYILFVVNDHVVKDIPIMQRVLNIQCTNDEKEYEFDELLKAFQSGSENEAFSYYRSKLAIYGNSISIKAIISFLSMYLGIVFMITCAAIIAIQQLSEAADNRERYRLLVKLGTGKKMLNRALFIQNLCYFIFPLMLAIIHSVVGLRAANDVIKNFGHVDVTATIIATAAFVVMIYGSYFVLTYIGSKSIINKG